MTVLVLLALCGIVAKLWNDVGTLRARLAMLEQATPDEQPITEPVHRPTARVVHTPAAQAAVTLADRPAVTLPARHELPLLVRPELVEGPSPDSANVGRPSTSSERTEAGATPIPNSVTPTRRAPGFEDIFGRRLPIWAGGVTLAVCGFLIVRYSIDAGLLSPLVRVIAGLLFGTALIAGAEAALRQEHRVRDPRVRQALAGAGVATLYASVLVASNLYALVPPLVAFGGLALLTLFAAFLSLRFGAPSAVLGLVGGLAAPALVGTGEPNVPLLAGYLALAVGGLATLGRAQRWWWLGVAALVGGFGWGAALLLTGALTVADSLSIGALLLLLGVGLPVLLFDGARGATVRLLGTLAAAAQLAALVATGGFTMLHWGLFGLLAIASVALSRRERALADLPVPALATALLLIAAWPDPTSRALTVVLAGAAAIFGIPAASRLWSAEGRLSDAGAVAALGAAVLAAPLIHLNLTDPTLTLLALAGAFGAAGVASMGWRVAARRDDARFAMLTTTAAVLLAAAAAFGLPERAVAPALALIAGGTLLLARNAADRRVEITAWLLQLAAVVALPFTGNALDRAYGESHGLPQFLDGWEAARWVVVAAIAALFALRAGAPNGRRAGAVLGVLLGYVSLAQITLPALLPLIPAAGLAALGTMRRSDAATYTAGVLAALWAAYPLALWLSAGGGALLGFPLYVDALPLLADAATCLVAPAAAAALVLRRHPATDARVRLSWLAGIALLGGAAAHIIYKHLFGIADPAAFIRVGLAERTVWEALLALTAVLLIRRAHDIARALGLAALAHFAWFTIALHNPLWSEQAVGALPVANLLLPAYALGFALLWAAGRQHPLPPMVERARGWAQMALVLLFAASELRQLTHGSILAHGNVGAGEDIARSVLAIGIAIGFLQWGIRHHSRDWRIASLVVMLAAVLKVFLLDTSGLDGLLRIAAFAALGFSLIGIGWLYRRHLPDADAVVNPTSALA